MGGNWEENCFMVRPMQAERITAILRHSSQLILGLPTSDDASSAWTAAGVAQTPDTAEEFRSWRPLEYCAALLLAALIIPERKFATASEAAWRCDLEKGPAAAGVAREMWGPIILLLRRLYEGHRA